MKLGFGIFTSCRLFDLLGNLNKGQSSAKVSHLYFKQPQLIKKIYKIKIDLQNFLKFSIIHLHCGLWPMRILHVTVDISQKDRLSQFLTQQLLFLAVTVKST